MKRKNDASPKRDRVKRKGHVIDLQIATVHGMIAAGVYWHISYLVDMNNAQRDHIDEEGLPWMYQTLEQIASHMPYLSVGQVKRALQLLKDEGLIISKDHPNKFVKSLGYTLAADQWLPKIWPIDGPDLAHGRAKFSPWAGQIQPMYIGNKDSYEDSYENTNTHLASLGDAPTSSSLSVGFGVSSIGNGEADQDTSMEASSVHSAASRGSVGIKTPPPTPPPLKTRKTARPVGPLHERIERAPMVFTSEKEHAQLLTTRSPELLAKAYEEVSDWKVSTYETDPKKALAHTDFYRVKGWGTRTAHERFQPSRGSASVPRKGHIHADEIAKQDMKNTTPQQVNTGTTLIRKFKYTLETCLEIYRKGGLKLEEIREVFPEYTGDGT